MNNRTRLELEESLRTIAANYAWTWNPTARIVFDRLPATNGSKSLHPAARVESLDSSTWARLAADHDFVDLVKAARARGPQVSAGSDPRPIAYFSPEFGVSEHLPQYSGGLGILAGDHLKAASDLAIPLIGVGLFYRDGFFHQRVADDRQVERYQLHDPRNLALTDTGTVVEVTLSHHDVAARVWRADVGSTRLFLLDTNVDGNDEVARHVSDRLYSGNQEHRLRQEFVMGVGGARALRQLGIEPSVYHLNEGHAGFLALELLAHHLAAGTGFADAVAKIRDRIVFTTHTPVPAGIDRFPHDLMRHYLQPWVERHGISMEALFDLGHMPDDGGYFNMAAFCLRVSGKANGVSRLHAEVSREMFSGVGDAAPIISITNGVHARTWVFTELQHEFDTRLGAGWAHGDQAAWDRVDGIADEPLRAILTKGRQGLVDLIDERVGPDHDIDPRRLTIGFARRFATYKRADLLLRHRDRLIELLADDAHPVQFVFAGKAHPADEPGKAVLQRVIQFARSPESRGRFVFIPDYDIGAARAMYAGTDVWLNNPIRPREACGTSGEKAALNGALNLSILDGWWNEGYDGSNGWAIPSSNSSDPDQRDIEESADLHDIIERDVVPRFYSSPAPYPAADWLAGVRHGWRTLGPFVPAARMVDEYNRRLYEPARRSV